MFYFTLFILVFSTLFFGFNLGALWQRHANRKTAAALAEAFLDLGLVARIDADSARRSLTGLLCACRVELIVRKMRGIDGGDGLGTQDLGSGKRGGALISQGSKSHAEAHFGHSARLC
jgi:hypothetical protein